jgi:hypothetical protein
MPKQILRRRLSVQQLLQLINQNFGKTIANTARVFTPKESHAILLHVQYVAAQFVNQMRVPMSVHIAKSLGNISRKIVR